MSIRKCYKSLNLTDEYVFFDVNDIIKTRGWFLLFTPKTVQILEMFKLFSL